jgi:signal transduction histidine kinase
LSGAQKILLGLGGNISFESEPGKGTLFDIYLPKAAAAKGERAH